MPDSSASMLSAQPATDTSRERERYTRRVSAILHADVAGYSRLIGEDERGTHRLLLEYQTAIAAFVAAGGGRVVDAEGDSLLIEFPAAAEAVICALRLQQSLEERNALLAERRRMRFRMGIHLAEIHVDRDRDRLFGTGVNVAARLEALAKPGAVCVSESVRAAIPADLPLAFVDLGERSLKNIDVLVRVWHIDLLPGATLPPNTHSTGPGRGEARAHAGNGRIGSSAARATRTDLTRDNGLDHAAPRPVPIATALTVPARLLGGSAVASVFPGDGARLWSTVERTAPIRSGNPTRRLDIAGTEHARLIRRWLWWARARFGRRRTLQWRLFDFCLSYALVYSSLFFLFALVFLGGDEHVGELRVSVLEVGAQARTSMDAEPAGPVGEAGAIPLMILVFVGLSLARRVPGLRACRHPGSGSGHELTTLTLWTVVLVALAAMLGAVGVGAALVALTVSIGVWHIRAIPGAGLWCWSLTSAAIAVLAVITSGAEAGDATMTRIADGLHDLHATDVDRFLLFWSVLPAVNALADYLSWRASRRFGLAVYGGLTPHGPFAIDPVPAAVRAKGTARVPVVLHWGLIDLLVGGAAVLCLAASLGFAMEMLDILRRDDVGFYDMSASIESFVAAPLGAGFWLTAMFATTLVPTALHLLAVGLALARSLVLPGSEQLEALTTLKFGRLHPDYAGARSRLATYLIGHRVSLALFLCAWVSLLLLSGALLLEDGRLLRAIGDVMIVGQQFAGIVADLFG